MRQPNAKEEVCIGSSRMTRDCNTTQPGALLILPSRTSVPVSDVAACVACQKETVIE